MGERFVNTAAIFEAQEARSKAIQERERRKWGRNKPCRTCAGTKLVPSGSGMATCPSCRKK